MSHWNFHASERAGQGISISELEPLGAGSRPRCRFMPLYAALCRSLHLLAAGSV